MTPERWRQVDEVLQAALEKAPAERSGFLSQACAGDAELLAEVESLLGFQRETDEFLETPPAVLAAEAVKQTTAELKIGQELGHYRLDRLLGRGGMGAVYLAHDTKLGRQVAIKLLPQNYTRDVEKVRRFRQEARAISALNHPNILTIYEIGEAFIEAENTHFIATEFVEGRTLRACLNDGDMTLGQVLDVAIQTASALAVAHQAGIIHRDIKPENIMLRPDEVLKVLDFGLAKLTSQRVLTAAPATFSTVDTNPGQIMGTISYMSPEQARGFEVDERSDIFSLGVVLYEMLTSRAPFAGATTGDVLVAILDRDPVPLKKYAPALPIELQRIVSQAMAKVRDQRYQRAADLLGDLKELKQELELAARLKRSGDTPAGQVSLNLRVGQGVPDAAVSTDSAANFVTAPLTKPGFFRRFSRPLKLSAAVLALSFSLAGMALYRYWLSDDEEIHSIAVLPFANEGNDPQTEYLSDGITESLLQNLQEMQQMPEISVMARGTVFTYKGREIDPRQLGRELPVQAVITGRVQRQGERLLIVAELASTRDGRQLWSERYQKPLADLPAVQEEIANEISIKLRPRLQGTPRVQVKHRYSTNSEANQLYLKGLYEQRQLAPVNRARARDYYNQAILTDPSFALAYSGLARTYIQAAGDDLLFTEAMPKIRQAALTALSLNEHLPDAHFAMAIAKYWGDWDWQGAEQEFKLALSLNPDYTDSILYYTSLLYSQKRFDEAIREAQRLEKLDPLSPEASIAVQNAFYYARLYDRSIEQGHKILMPKPTDTWVYVVHYNLGRALLAKGQLQAAFVEFRQAVEIQRNDYNLSWLAFNCAALGRNSESLEILRELTIKAQHEYVSPSVFARTYMGLGQHKQALKYLRLSYDQHSDDILRLAVDPIYEPLRNDPRFITMLRGIGLTP